MSSRVAFGKRKHTANKKLLTAREQKRLEWWSVRSKEGNLKNEDKERKLESENITDKVEEPKAKKLKLEDETKLQTDSNDRSNTKTTQKKKKKAYILFVGNLPYTVSAEEIREHFSKTGDVKEVRLLTRKGTDDSRGCAYVEFENRTSHMFGLKMNESLLGGRKINVEFTSRGRNTPLRMERLKEKNKRASRFRQPVKEDEE